VAALLTAAALAASSAWGAGPGSLDTGFSDDGWATVPIDTADSTDIVEGLAVQRNGKLVARREAKPSPSSTTAVSWSPGPPLAATPQAKWRSPG
jgi:hypothetical protein